MERIDFSYEISDERLHAYAKIPILDRLRWLEEVRQFTLMVRHAPTAKIEQAQEQAENHATTNIIMTDDKAAN